MRRPSQVGFKSTILSGGIKYLVAVDPPAKSLTFWGFSRKLFYFNQKVKV